MSLASDRPEFTPPSSQGRGRAIGLAIFAHVLLIAALTWGVSWKREANNAPVQAELWSTTVQQAAPAMVEPQSVPKPEPKIEPPPPPPKPAKVVEPDPVPQIDPQIAIEKAKKIEEKKKLDKKKASEAKALAKQKAEEEEEAEEEARLKELAKKKRTLEAKKAKDAKDAKDAKAAEENDKQYEASLKASREANLKRIAGIAGASGGETATGTAKQSTGPSAGYGGRVVAKIKPNIVLLDDIGNPEALVEVRLSPDGTILSSKLVKSSGVKAWDESVIRAIVKTEKLPRDIDGTVPAWMTIGFRPKDMQ